MMIDKSNVDGASCIVDKTTKAQFENQYGGVHGKKSQIMYTNIQTIKLCIYNTILKNLKLGGLLIKDCSPD